MGELWQFVLGSIGFGSVYALAALGLVFIFKTSGVVNFAFGAMGSVVALVLWALLTQAHVPLVLAWLIALVIAMGAGVLIDVGLMQRIERSPLLIQIVLTLGLLLFIEGFAGVLFGYNQKEVPPVLNGQPVGIFGANVQPNTLFIFAFTVVLGVISYFTFERTRAGLAARAVAHNREIAALMGVNTHRVVSVSWAVGVLLSGVAAILVTPSLGLTPNLMDNVAVYAFAAAVLGGFGSIPGAIIGGLLIGVVSNLVAGYLSTNLQLSLVFLLILVLLYARPQGLFGVRSAVRQ